MNILFDLIEKNEDFKKEVGFKKIHCNANHVLVKDNELHNEIFLIINGGVRIISRGAVQDKKQIKPGLADMSTGDIFGEFCLFDDDPASASVIATEDSELYEIDAPSLKKFMQNHPDDGFALLWQITTNMVQRIRRANKTVLDLLVWGLKAHKIDADL